MLEITSCLHSIGLPKLINANDELTSLKGETILFLEDDHVNYLYFRDLLLDTGATITRAINFSQALHTLTISSNISLVLLSASFAENIDNVVLKHIRTKYSFLPLIVILNKNINRIDRSIMRSKCDTSIDFYTDSSHFIEVIKEILSPSNFPNNSL
jgi:CheY-like chemotaxis protein